MDGLRIETNGDKIDVFTPYNKQFINDIKKIGSAKWNPNNKCWTLPVDYITNVREVMKEVFGNSDIENNETIRVKIKFIYDESACQEPIKIFGKNVSVAHGRDSGAKVGEDVILENGEINSGGSARYWTSEVSKGSIFSLLNVNKNVFTKEKNNPLYEIEILEIIEEVQKSESLIEEKKRLLARIEEIDKILEKINK